MFAHFCYEHFPFVTVTLSEKLNNNDDYQQFISEWQTIYLSNKNFVFIFDTSNVGYIAPQYCMSLSGFINNINKNRRDNLKGTYVIISKKNNIVLRIIDMAFMVQKVHTPVYITNNIAYDLIQSMRQNDGSISNLIMKTYEPKASKDEMIDDIFGL